MSARWMVSVQNNLTVPSIGKAALALVLSLAAGACFRSIPTPEAEGDVMPVSGPVVFLSPDWDPGLFGYGGYGSYGRYSPGTLSGAYAQAGTLYSADGWPIGTLYPGSAGYALPYATYGAQYGYPYGMPYAIGGYGRAVWGTHNRASLSRPNSPTPIPRMMRPRAPRPAARVAPPPPPRPAPVPPANGGRRH